MKQVISTEKLPIKIWTDSIEDGALEQAKNLANLPFAFKHIAIMPDTHPGFGMPIGGVLATKDVIVPNAVGVDIGCGMCAVKTSLTYIDIDTLKKIMGEIRKVIPVGFNKHKEVQEAKLLPVMNWNKNDITLKEIENARKSLGTLGGGNHFIEIQKGSDGHIWIMIHSGSRNLGKQVADHYNNVAIELNKKWFSETQKELNFLPIDSKEGKDYIREMNYCVEFALANRKLMMDRIIDIFKNEYRKEVIEHLPVDEEELDEDFEDCLPADLSDITFEPMINIAHNYAQLENHYGENVWVHRKGATLATKDTIGIIPGSQGTKSYIVKGLGNKESFMSCSHGAGRKMGRNEAIKTLSLEEEIKKLDNMGVIHAIRGQKDLDEAPGSYKPIDEVMRNQADLVEILVELTPLAVIKG